MSDLSLRLQQAHSQLPVSSYFDEQLFQRELQVLFQHGPRYVGHSRSVPEVGDYHVLPQELGGRALVPDRGRDLDCGHGRRFGLYADHWHLLCRAAGLGRAGAAGRGFPGPQPA